MIMMLFDDMFVEFVQVAIHQRGPNCQSRILDYLLKAFSVTNLPVEIDPDNLW